MQVCVIESAAMGMSVQDQGRAGWARFGVPPSGPMDDYAASWANRLLGNSDSAPVLEVLGPGARLRFVSDAWIAIAGAKMNVPGWRAMHVDAGDVLRLGELQSGLWSYIAVEGGFDEPKWLGSASVYPRGTLGRLLVGGDVLYQHDGHRFTLPAAGVAGRVAPWTEQRDYSKAPALRVWPAPQWDRFSEEQRRQFFSQAWIVTSQSDRVGYRLSGEAVARTIGELISEPMIAGTIQVPENGQPIVTMRDGPTVGGYPKLGVVDARDLSWLAQTQPGRPVRFQLADEI